MFWLIETQEQFEELESSILTGVVAIPIHRHPEHIPQSTLPYAYT
jgi:hypothetical protein